jgi:hypothetical protein
MCTYYKAGYVFKTYREKLARCQYYFGIIILENENIFKK